MSSESGMRRFLLAFVMLLAVSFALELTPWAQAWIVTPWTDTVAAPVLLYPVVLLVRVLARLALPGLVHAVEHSSTVVTFVTALKPAGVAASAVLTVDVNLLLYSFGLPLLAALSIAAREPAWKRHLAVGYAVLLPCFAWCVLADFL